MAAAENKNTGSLTTKNMTDEIPLLEDFCATVTCFVLTAANRALISDSAYLEGAAMGAVAVLAVVLFIYRWQKEGSDSLEEREASWS